MAGALAGCPIICQHYVRFKKCKSRDGPVLARSLGARSLGSDQANRLQ